MSTDKNTSIDRESTGSKLFARLGDRLETDKPLAPLTTFNTGGPARYLFTSRTADDVSAAIKAAVDLEIPFFVLGGGSNVLVSDSGFDGLVIRINIMGLKSVGGTDIESGSGEDLMSLVDFSAEQSLTGLEFASGIYGTVGGAICGNAGAYGGEIGSVVKRVTLVGPDGDARTIGRDDCRFEYRSSCFKDSSDVIVGARFTLKSGQTDQIRKKIGDILLAREAKFPPQIKSAGCFFKNVPDSGQEFGKLPAGRLLEQAGAKKMAVGGARVHENHSNLIVNSNAATSKDIRELADKMKEKVFEMSGIRLEEEVTQVGNF
ncbi:MAG: UDP-N-acetylmuramate dehydrogenase [candidate division Zixibacteria bacterium]|nr:UDP-N-acetylmuramate dehydrogenase [candidate division Zixibacteria bacterium]